MLKYYSDKFAPKTKLPNCLLLLEGTCQCIELEPVLIQNAKISTALLKRGESIENEIEIYLTSKFFFQN